MVTKNDCSHHNDCPNCKLLREEVAELRKENAELKDRLDRIEAGLRSSKRQANPFSRGKKESSAGKKKGKPGRKKGEGKFSFRQPPSSEEITFTEKVPLECCPDCGSEVCDPKEHHSYQEDIEVHKVITKFITQSGYCETCKKRVRSRHPEQTSTATGAAGVFLGPTVKALGAKLKHDFGVTYPKISRFFRTFDFHVTKSGLCQSNQQLAVKANPLYRALWKALRESCRVGVDETGWRIGVLNAWLWVFTSKQATVYTIERSRGHEVVVKILGKEFKGILHSDCFSAYDHKALEDWIQQKCFSHFLNTLKKMKKEKKRGAVRFPREVSQALKDAIQLYKDRDSLTSRQFVRRRGKIERRIDDLIDSTRQFSDADNVRFAKRLRKQRKHLFRFLYDEDAEPTNNQSERMLRPAVISRKVGGCNKTNKGARTHAILASILATIQQQGRDVLDFLKQILTNPNLPADALCP